MHFPLAIQRYINKKNLTYYVKLKKIIQFFQ